MSTYIKGIAYDLVKTFAVTLFVSYLLTDSKDVKSIEVNTPQQVKTHSKLKLSLDFVYESESE